MADIFISYASGDRPRVAPLVSALLEEGWSVWWDPQIAPGQEFDRLISAELDKARAVIVVWTPTSVASRWVRGEAREAAERGLLVPVRFESAQLPIDARAIHTTDMDGWAEDRGSVAYQALVRAVRSLLTPELEATGATREPPAPRASARPSICVLPFANISGDVEQEYFSDGISEDIITDLSKVAALSVASRSTAFTYKDRRVGIPQLARQLGVTHVVGGSVRKSGNRVRITAELVEAATDSHIWAERYDRELDDIFAVQDEISRAIVEALKVRLSATERQAFARRSTNNAEAYRLYLLARSYWLRGWARHRDLIVRLCRRAIDLDASYARAWALLSICQADQRFSVEGTAGEGWAAAERALSLDPDLAEAHAAKGRILTAQGRFEEARSEHEIALALDPSSYEVNAGAARWAIATKRFEDALRFLSVASSSDEADYWAPGMAITCNEASGNVDGARAAAQETMARVERALAAEPDNGGALGFGAAALTTLGEIERAKAWIEHALLLDPDNNHLRYNLACSMVKAGEPAAALDLLEECLGRAGLEVLIWVQVDSDLDPMRGHPRFKGMIAATQARLGAADHGAHPRGAASDDASTHQPSVT
jgi:adenylate cyclase